MDVDLYIHIVFLYDHQKKGFNADFNCRYENHLRNAI